MNGRGDPAGGVAGRQPSAGSRGPLDDYYWCYIHQLDSRDPQDHHLHEKNCRHFPLDEPVLMKCGHPRATRMIQPTGTIYPRAFRAAHLRTVCWACQVEREIKEK